MTRFHLDVDDRDGVHRAWKVIRTATGEVVAHGKHRNHDRANAEAAMAIEVTRRLADEAAERGAANRREADAKRAARARQKAARKAGRRG